MDKIRENIIDIDIKSEMKSSYMDYAMSVIVSRALPDVRDGLKPVHRRIIYAMDELSMGPNRPYRKSARLVGDVLGKYHPHGDTSVYHAMVRLAQDFNTRYLLVDGHGNFGSVDGDGAAAMRYTEARMQNLTVEMLRDIDKETVDFAPNFDETLKEPTVLPSRFPNLLVNGSSGIAVGMATNIPPHNLGEIIDGIELLIEKPEVTIEELMTKIKGPDFPTGGQILGVTGIREAYETGRGRVIMRAVSDIEVNSNGRESIVITELPYQVNKANEIERMARLVRDKVLDGITHIRDESDRDGMRIVIEISRDANAEVVLNNIYKRTRFQETFGVIMLALVDNEPKILNLKEMLSHYLTHQIEIVTRRTEFDLKKAEDRKHIVEGLRIAQDNIDEIIKIIRESNTDQEAAEILENRFELTEIQSKSILDMRLRRLTGLEIEKLDAEFEELVKTIKDLNYILNNESEILKIIKEELHEIKEKYDDERRSEIIEYHGEIQTDELIEEEDIVITFTNMGYIKRMPEDIYRTQRRGGRGIIATNTRDGDYVRDLYITSTHDNILFFTNLGKVYSLRGYEILQSGRQARGTPIVNLLPLEEDEKVTTIIPVEKELEGGSLAFVTEKGIIKRGEIKDYSNIRRSGIIAITLREDDKLIQVKRTHGDSELILISENGKSIRFDETKIREMGRTAIGVRGIDLEEDDKIVSMEVIDNKEDYLVTVTENGYGKKTHLDNYKNQNRGGKGIITQRINDKTKKVVEAKIANNHSELMLISKNGIMIRIKAEEISEMGRNTQGVSLMRLEEGDKTIAIARYEETEDEEKV